MSSKHKSLKTKLIIWYSVLFSLLLIIVFSFTHKQITSSLQNQADDKLKKIIPYYDMRVKFFGLESEDFGSVYFKLDLSSYKSEVKTNKVFYNILD